MNLITRFNNRDTPRAAGLLGLSCYLRQYLLLEPAERRTGGRSFCLDPNSSTWQDSSHQKSGARLVDGRINWEETMWATGLPTETAEKKINPNHSRDTPSHSH